MYTPKNKKSLFLLFSGRNRSHQRCPITKNRNGRLRLFNTFFDSLSNCMDPLPRFAWSRMTFENNRYFLER